MGKVTGFLEVEREDSCLKPVPDRLKSWQEFVVPLNESKTREQASRCMDCGIPFCHSQCPVNNQIPDWNDLVYNCNWEAAAHNLHLTNNFPEITGRICPAPCETGCTLYYTDEAVAIKTIERGIADRAWQEGWIKPQPVKFSTGKRIAVVGSGPAGLAAAQQLARAGHDVHVYEKNSRPGGLMVYGIPDFKLEKNVVARRVQQLEAEGVTFHCNCHVGVDKSIREIKALHDAVILAGGSETPRDLPVPGRELSGIHFAMSFLTQQNRRIQEEPLSENGTDEIAKGRKVVVIGGGDTGSDCIGTSLRQGAEKVVQIEIMPIPPKEEIKDLTWPYWPIKMRTSSSQAEGAYREFSAMTKRFEGDSKGRVAKIICCRAEYKKNQFKEIQGSEFEIETDLVLLAMGFTRPAYEDMLADINIELDDQGNVKANDIDYQTSQENVFVAGDMRRGQSLVVWAIREGRQVAHAVDKSLLGHTTLPR
ncbi:MAG: glutamate synthase subunit beta [Hyphomicrobiaceae bacterium]|nr:glutamate synthase subunit beta [Hyphomicrobiaceae bacterium]